MEEPVALHMSSNVESALNISYEDQLSSNACSSAETGNCTLPKKLDNTSNTILKEEIYFGDKRTTSRLIFPYITCLRTDCVIYCFILSVWDNIVGPQTVYVWKKSKNNNPFKVKSEKSSRCRSKSLSDEQEFCYSNVDTSVTSHSCSLSTNEDYKFISVSGTNESLKNINITYSELQDCADSNASIPSNNLTINVQQYHDDKFSSFLTMELNLSFVVKYVTEHSVGVGESDVSSSRMVFHLLIAPSQNIIVLSVKFSVNENGVGVPYCMSAVIPSENESLVLPALNLCSDALLRISAKVRLLITKDGIKSGNKVQAELIELCETLASLRDANLNQYPIENFCCKPDDRRLAERMLTSHLQTMGTTLVIADSPSEANKVVMWLAQFLSEDDLSISRIALSDFQWPYQPGITIQAVIRDSSGGIDLSSSKLLCSRYPLTLVDLTTNTVRQMANVNVHSTNSEATFRQQLLTLWHDLDHIPAPSHSLFEDVEVSSPMVKRFLHEWDRLASCQLKVRQKYLKSFLRSLQYYALAIIVWTQNEWTAERRRREQKTLLQTITSTFLLEDADVKVLLAQAELFQPGFMSLVFE